MALLEVACFGPASAIIAGKAGADRIELCADQLAGGTTPPQEWLVAVKAEITVPVFVMIRPRGGDFHYSNNEFEAMKAVLLEFKSSADGFVFGVLHSDRTVDVARTAELVRMADPLPCTFHQAFDKTPDPLAALEHVVAAGCHAVLSSGGSPDVITGMRMLERLVEAAQGRITVMPGGGVRFSNLDRLRKSTKASAFHSSAVPKGAALPDKDEVEQMVRLLHA